MENPYSLAVQAKVLRKGLRNGKFHIQAIVKVSYGKSILLQVSRSKTLAAKGQLSIRLEYLKDLLCHIKHGKQPNFSANVGNNLPLALRKIRPSRIVCARMKYDYISFLGILAKSFRHPFKVDLRIFHIKVWVESLLNIWASELPNLRVVDPTRVRDPNRLGLQPGREEQGGNVISPRARNGLN